MGAFNPRKFVNPDTLRRVSFANLILLLNATAKVYLGARHDDGAPRADLGSDEAHFDFDRLAHVLVHSDDCYPDDAVHHVAELADGDEMLQEEMGGALDLTLFGPEPVPSPGITYP
jgi:hypothetical protein